MYTSDENTIIFDCNFNQIISNDITNYIIENKLSKIIFSDYLDNSIALICENDHDNKILFTKYYENIKGSKFNQEINNLPNSITHIILGTCFSQSVDYLPESLIYLRLGILFNQSLDNLPLSLTHLMINSKFTHTLNNLPEKIIYLKISYNSDYNLSISNLSYLKNLTHLILNYNYNNSIDNLPDSIKHLRLGANFRAPINTIPDSLEEIIFTDSSLYTLEYFDSVYKINSQLEKIYENNMPNIPYYPLNLVKISGYMKVENYLKLTDTGYKIKNADVIFEKILQF